MIDVVQEIFATSLSDHSYIHSIMSTFFMFWIYAAPAARMAALQGLRFIGIATHDSIGIGEDGEQVNASMGSHANTDRVSSTPQALHTSPSL